MAGTVAQDENSMDSTGIGLSNVIARFRLYFGREDTLAIYSDGPGKGTEVVITIPLVRETPDEKEAVDV